MAELTTSIKQRYIDALVALQQYLESENGLDVIVREGEKLKVAGKKIGLSTARIWQAFDAKGNLDEANAAIAGITFRADDLNNIGHFVSEEDIIGLSDEEKLVLDALGYSLTADLNPPPLAIALALNPGSEVNMPVQEIIVNAFNGLDFTRILKDKAGLLASIADRIAEVQIMPEQMVSLSYDESLLPGTQQTKPADDLQQIFEQEQERRARVDAERTPKSIATYHKAIEDIEGMVRSELILSGVPSNQALLIKEAKRARDLCQDLKAGSFVPEVNKLRALYTQLVAEALYLAIEGGENVISVTEIAKAMNLSFETGSLGREVVSNVIEHFETLADAVAALDDSEATMPILQKALKLAASMGPLVSGSDVNDRMLEAQAKLFLTEVKQDIRDTTLRGGGWHTWSHYRISMDGESYAVPKRIHAQYKALERWEQGESATKIMEEVREIGQKQSSAWLGPNETTRHYFDAFKKRYAEVKSADNEVITDDLTQPRAGT